jgi:hypothetical protein
MYLNVISPFLMLDVASILLRLHVTSAQKLALQAAAACGCRV